MADEETQDPVPTPEVAPEVAPEPEAAPEAPPDLSSIGVLQAGVYVFVPNPGHDRARTVLIGGQIYEHVAEDVHGRWLYRHLG